MGKLVVKYREKLKRLAAKYKLVIKDRDEMQSKYEKYISELRNKLKRSNEDIIICNTINHNDQVHFMDTNVAKIEMKN